MTRACVVEGLPRFQPGRRYAAHSICDYDTVFIIEVVSRTEGMLTYKHLGNVRRSKIHVDAHGEFVMPDRYSMAPVFRADREG